MLCGERFSGFQGTVDRDGNVARRRNFCGTHTRHGRIAARDYRRPPPTVAAPVENRRDWRSRARGCHQGRALVARAVRRSGPSVGAAGSAPCVPGAGGADSEKPAMPPVRQQLRLVGYCSSCVPEVPAGLQTTVHGPNRRLALLVGCSFCLSMAPKELPGSLLVCASFVIVGAVVAGTTAYLLLGLRPVQCRG